MVTGEVAHSSVSFSQYIWLAQIQLGGGGNSKDFKGALKVERETGQGLPRSGLGGGGYDQNTLHTSMNF